jgi:hypothetical protein
MSKLIRDHLRGNVIGYVALFFALSTGSAVALNGQNTVFSDDITNGEVRSADVADDTTANALTGTDIADESLTGSDIGFGVIESADIADSSIAAADLETNAVGLDEIATAAVGQDEIATFGVGAAEITSDAVGASELQTGGVGQNEIATDGVAGTEIVNSSVRSADINTNAVGAADLAAIVTRTNTVTSPNTGSSFSVTASCNAGERILAGGANWTPARYDTHIIESHNDGNSWRVVGAIGTNGPGFAEDPSNLTAEAYCLPAGT